MQGQGSRSFDDLTGLDLNAQQDDRVVRASGLLESTQAQSRLAICFANIQYPLFLALKFIQTTLITTALSGYYLNELFTQLKKYDAAPSEEIQKTWLVFLILSASAIANGAAHAVNANHARQDEHARYFAAEERCIYPLFSSSFAFIFIQALSAQGKINFSLGEFCGISAVSVLAFVVMALKIATPDSSDVVIWSERKFDQLGFQPNTAATNIEKLKESVVSAKLMLTTFSVFLTTVFREQAGKTVPLPIELKIALGCLAPFVSTLGYRSFTEFKRYQSYAMFMYAMQYGALVYMAVSGISAGIINSKCDLKEDCVRGFSSDFLNAINFFVAVSFGIFSAMTTLIDPNRSAAFFSRREEGVDTAGLQQRMV